jgi:UPF0755 protein
MDPDEDYVVLPPPTRGGRRLLAVAALVLAGLGLVLGGAVFWASRQITPSGGQGDLIDEVVIPAGSSTEAISEILADEGVISNPRVFRWYTGWKGAGPWDAGRYLEFRTNSSYDQAIAVLDEGPAPPTARTVQVPEGKTVAQTLTIISESMPGVTNEQLLTALGSGQVTSRYKPADVKNWEGFLFPDTYQFEESTPPAEILQTMSDRTDDVLDELGYDKAEALQGRSAYELVTIASLIERETGQPPEERGKIARVIFNRLEADETLGIDASNLYGLGRTSGELTKADLEVDSPYNLRTSQGLPPTPIANPGRASLQAAIEPTPGDWRYYVLTTNDPPTHLFTDSFEEFEDAVADARARGVF